MAEKMLVWARAPEVGHSYRQQRRSPLPFAFAVCCCVSLFFFLLSSRPKRRDPLPMLASVSIPINPPSFRLDARVALVTGAGRGIGAEAAVALASAGAE